ncbi:hypothetical protein CTK_C04210 [Clostridium tyrobutyricum]|nr:hypothetical protein CTK_C04210 [Clostridium tyrobutyricum]
MVLEPNFVKNNFLPGIKASTKMDIPIARIYVNSLIMY